MSSTRAKEMRPHAVCMPYPAQGHIHATLKLARLLHSKGFHITFVHTESNYNRILSAGDNDIGGLDDFRFETIPDGVPPHAQGHDSLLLAVRHKLASPFRGLLERMNDPCSGVPPVSCIISDTFTTFTVEVAEEFGIPDVFFCSVSAVGYLGFIQFKDLAERGLMPIGSENGYLETPIDWIPGIKNIRLKNLPNIRIDDPDNIIFDLLKDEAQGAPRASAIIINTFEDLEEEVLNAMASFLPPIYTIGPLTLLCRQELDSSVKTVGFNSLWREDSSCLQWLEGRAPGSVMYVNFGSIALMTDEQLIEFGWGLANSGHDFLWVIRPNSKEGDHSSILPKEFSDETRDRGLLTTWCPQEEVLMHPSVGGFLTHCGWNSTMESLSAGVPMLCWPYIGDQPTNCWYLCSQLGIGIEVDSNVKREGVEGLIRELMGGERGKEMKNKALEWKEAAVKATEPGGKSYVNLDRVIKEVLLARKE
ncbi:uncharacterized protein A4U43_C08F21300 [Asparagus officinalis]|uniref:7-deoxyloganetin glucosyltransferase-like n=1 Tax=Asparagus officinalis TaxID=4686 RepID=UPI00098DE9E0|nr:7-deoxyloganetin glucosyltransferase-like [Asparagus officinalis]ONK60670.1 uncharacterized protein A4U43_C08F21300 [Asparagus officinalis]